MARGGQVQIWRCVLAGGVQRSSLSVKRTVPAFTGAEASATACPSHGRGICFYRVGDYQIAPIAARSTAMGRWRLTPPGYGGTCLPAGRFADLTRHRRVIQYRGPIKGKAWGCSGRSEKRLPWLGQAVAEASAPVNAGTVLLTDNGDERLCPREYAANHCRV